MSLASSYSYSIYIGTPSLYRHYIVCILRTWKFRLRMPYNEFVPILKSASRPHSSTVPLPTLASSNLEALPLVGWAPRSAANGPLRVPSSRGSRRNESECASSKRNQALTGCPHVFLLANSTRGGHIEKPSASASMSSLSPRQ